LKGIFAAVRSVVITLLLLLLLLFIFGILFKLHAIDAVEDVNLMFETVPRSMWTCLLHGTFLDASSDILNVLVENSHFMTAMFLLFIFLSSFTLLNMLIGILCDVIQQVSKSEKEDEAVAYLKDYVLDILEAHDRDDDRFISKSEFKLLMRNPELHFMLTQFGVSVFDLVSLEDVLFDKHNYTEEQEGRSDDDWLSPTRNKRTSTNLIAFEKSTEIEPVLSFAEFLEAVLRLRGGNFATVRDVVDLRDFMRRRLDQLDQTLPVSGVDNPARVWEDTVAQVASLAECQRSLVERQTSVETELRQVHGAVRNLQNMITSLCAQLPRKGAQ